MKRLILLALILPIAATAAECTPDRDSHGAIQRSQTQVRKFRKTTPCPATGLSSGRCPGYVVDHIVPLCACGQDQPKNMQWQTTAEALKKDRRERAQCRGLA